MSTAPSLPAIAAVAAREVHSGDEWRRLPRLSGGRFVVSLDFELHWGVAELSASGDYRRNLLGVRDVVPSLLDLFEEYGIRATWATVGMLLARSRSELRDCCPATRPTYGDGVPSTYTLLDSVGAGEDDDPLHFGHELAAMIVRAPGQELATHTFAHYFCLAPGQRLEQFTADLRAAIAITRRTLGIEVRSIVFPRNQFASEHLRACAALGIRAFRGTPDHWLYRPAPDAGDTIAHRGGRLADAYVPLCRRTVDHPRLAAGGTIVDVPASRFLLPVGRAPRALDALRAWRIRAEMDEAARRGAVYHLWWHPHNFGASLGENVGFLRTILDHYRRLRERRGMVSASMIDVANEAGTVGS